MLGPHLLLDEQPCAEGKNVSQSQPEQYGELVKQLGPRPALIVAGLGLIGLAAALASGLLVETDDLLVKSLWVFSPILIGIAGYLFWCAMWIMRLYEQGIVLGQKELHFREIRSYVYEATERHANGIYWGTTTRMVFQPALSSKKAIDFTWLAFWSDQTIEEFHIRMTDYLAERILKTLAAGHRFQWTDKISLEQGGLVTKNGLVRFSDVEIEPIHIMVKSVFIFKDKGRNKKIAEIDFGTPNLFPVLEVIEKLATKPKPQADPLSPNTGRGNNYHSDRLSF